VTVGPAAEPRVEGKESESAGAADPYSARRVGSGLLYLVGGKAATSIAGIGTFLILVRGLSVAEFAAYSILFALVEIVDALTGVGTGEVLTRYVPELYVQRRTRAMRRLIAIGLGLRIVVMTLFLTAVWLLAPTIAPLIGLSDWEWALRLYLGVVFFRVAATTLFTILESMLQQAIAQVGFSSITALRFALLALASWQFGIDLETVLVIELLTDMLALAAMLGGLFRVLWRTIPQTTENGFQWLNDNLGRMFSFGMKGYLQYLLIMPFGGGTNRLLVGGALQGPEIALFGFAQSIAELMQRYLPVKLLAGVIRPVLTASFVRDREFSRIEVAGNVFFKVNAILVCLAAVVIAGGGGKMLRFISGGKYGEGAVTLLLLMCALVLLYSLRHMLDHVCHAVERNGPLVWSNALITLSVLPGIGMLPVLGVYALPAANSLGLLAGCALLLSRLRAEGFRYRQERRGLAAILAATAVGALTGIALGKVTDSWPLCALLAAIAFIAALLLLRPFRPDERDFAVGIVDKIRKKRAD